MKRRSISDLQYTYLQKMFEQAGGSNEWADLTEVDQELDVTENESTAIYGLLAGQGYIYGSFGKRAFVTSEGHAFLDDYMAKTYAEHEMRVMQALVKMGESNKGLVDRN
jgi:hypothetical protein